MLHLCDYCGGWDDGEKDNDIPTTWTALNIDFTFSGQDLKRMVCIKCLEKGLDKMFGKPIPSAPNGLD